MGSAFSTKTIYQFVATLETVFAVMVLAFAVNTLVVYHSEDGLKEYKAKKKDFVEYASIAASIQSVIQIVAAFLLVTKSKYNTGKHGKNIHPGLVPKLWMLHTAIQLLIQLSIFLTPTILHADEQVEVFNKGDKNLPVLNRMQKTLKELYTYTLVSAFFKIFFIWGVSSTLKAPKQVDSEGGGFYNQDDLEKADD